MTYAGSAISLFAGCGGLDLGVEQAGYRVVAATEWDDDAADTMEKNFDGLESEVVRRDIVQVTTRELLRAGGLGRSAPDLLIGGPPCTPFSKSGFWLEYKRAGMDPGASLLQAFTRVLAEARPRSFILENVYALTYNNAASRPAFERLLKEIKAAGYDFSWQVLNAADYGVAQARPRLFVVGSREGDAPRLPEPTHHGRWERQASGGGDHAYVTAGDVLDGLVTDPEPEEVVTGNFGELLRDVPPGENYLHFTEKRGHPDPKFEWRSRFWSFLLKLSPDRPSPTIQAQPGPYVGPFHWDSRRLRVAEARRLFGYPDDFEFVGTRSSVQRQLGNSVPPPLAMKVAGAVRDSSS